MGVGVLGWGDGVEEEVCEVVDEVEEVAGDEG